MNMDTTAIVYISAEVIVGLITVIGNSLVLAAIIKTRRLHTITNVFVGNLAIADIAVGLLVAPCAALSFMGLPKSFYGCVFINCLILMFTNVSILMLLSVAIERFLAIKEPFLYRRLLSVRRAILVNLCVWVLGCVLGFMPMYGWHSGYSRVYYCRFTDVITYEYMVYFQFFGLILMPLFIMLCIYIYILIIVRKHLRQTSALQNRFQQNNQTSDGFSKDVRAAKMFALVILMFGIFWFPVYLFNCVSLFCGTDCGFPSQALLAAIVMSHANSSINPFLYATSNSRIKGAIKELFGIKLSADEGSSTDHNHMRPTPNGTPHARENAVAPIFNVGDNSYYNDDAPSFAVSHDEIRPDIDKISETTKDQSQEGDKDITLNHNEHVVTNTDSRQSFNVNNKTQNHSLHSSNLSLSSFTKDEIQSERPSPVLKSQHLSTQPYLQLSRQDIATLYNIPPSSSLSYDHSHCHHDHVNGYYTGKSNLALLNGHVLNNKEEEGSHGKNCDKLEDSSISDIFNETCRISADDLGSKHQVRWDMKRSSLQDIWFGTDHNTVESMLIDRHVSNVHFHTHLLRNLRESNSPSESNEILLVARYNGSLSSGTTLSSLGCRKTISSEHLELTESFEDDTVFDYNGNNEINTGYKNKNSTSFKSSVLVDEYGILRNDKTEQTKL